MPEDMADKTGDTRTDRRSFIRKAGMASLGIATTGISGRTATTKPRRKQPILGKVSGNPLRIGMIGTTGHTNLVLDYLDRIEGARIVAYAFEDNDWAFNEDGSRRDSAYDLETRRRWVAARPWANIETTVYETYQEMLEKEQLDLAVVCLPYARNAYATTMAAEAGLHVLCEKPVAVNESDLAMVENAINNSGVRLSAMFNMRFAAPCRFSYETSSWIKSRIRIHAAIPTASPLMLIKA